MTDTIPERVARGMAWLDANEPGWERRIDLATLALSESCNCILGQVFATQANQEGRRSGYDWAYSWAYANELSLDLYDFGFAADDDDYPVLESTWIAAVKDRFDTGTLSG